jgi:hypothetical protein
MATSPRVNKNEEQKPMSDEDWAKNKDCDLSKRDHKWQWIHDPVTNVPSHDQVQCTHCGRTGTMTRGLLTIHDRPTT